MNPSFRMVALPVMALAASLASAQSTSFPSKSVRVVVPFAAGGTTDAAADPVANSPEQFGAFIQAELKKMGEGGAGVWRARRMIGKPALYEVATRS
jgi:tripartite-type tricarboxylate transporter receptor subunit TctC